MQYPDLSRRKAIHHLGLIGTGVALSPWYFCTSNEAKPLGVALVGLGNYATLQLAPALQQTKLCKLTGIVTGTPEKAKKWKEDYAIPSKNIYDYNSFDSIKNNPDIDIVYIVLPNFMHMEYTIRALQAGKHVICEKPMGMNATECKAMIVAAKKADRKLQIGYRLFYEPHHLEMIKRSSPHSTDRIQLIEASLGFDMARPGMWRIDKNKGGGGALMDLGVYTIQGARRNVGSLPISVSAQGYKDKPELFKEIYGTYTFQLRFADQSVCNSTVSFSAYSDRLHVARGNEYITLQPAFAANQIQGIKSRNAALIELPKAEFQQSTQMDAFAKNIIDNTPVVASGEEGLIDMQIVDAIKEAILSNQDVRINYS